MKTRLTVKVASVVEFTVMVTQEQLENKEHLNGMLINTGMKAVFNKDIKPTYHVEILGEEQTT